MPDLGLGELRVRPARRLLCGPGEHAGSSPRVMQALVALALRPGEVVSRDELIERCPGADRPSVENSRPLVETRSAPAFAGPIAIEWGQAAENSA